MALHDHDVAVEELHGGVHEALLRFYGPLIRDDGIGMNGAGIWTREFGVDEGHPLDYLDVLESVLAEKNGFWILLCDWTNVSHITSCGMRYCAHSRWLWPLLP